MMRVFFVVFLAGFLSAALSANPCRGSDRASVDPTITLDVQNEPLRSVLGRIYKTTEWKIKAPDKWMDKPITQTLYNVSIEKGLRFILKDAGVENLLLIYDEEIKTVTVYDTEIRLGQTTNRPTAQDDARPPVFSASDQPDDPMLKRPANDEGPRASWRTAQAIKRIQAYREEE